MNKLLLVIKLVGGTIAVIGTIYGIFPSFYYKIMTFLFGFILVMDSIKGAEE